ncbi:cc18e0dc-3590-46ea-8bd3-a7a057b9a70f [Sclerotinia trifoliorum]|uniref:Cc18e0dc-3590-46ea-8bd3-a7a057b9a70f n=1 Tax=Sclerotinia trifoliorum TaxID=28548 RepID=A0A8H2VX19_9HELO|nr:cc18e0dc-3590-46ea-8bd3-a7a057b9a70f [Sclerotinia trifoliorum]
MADVEEPQFTTLAQRIAALKQQQADDSLVPQNNSLAIAKRPPPPPIPSSNRPPLPTRPKTANNPPILTYGSAVNQKPFNEPIGAKSNSPSVDRDGPTNNAKSPALPPRNAPPPLPTRKASTPSLPPRRASTSTQLARRGSGDSTISQVSTVSAISLNSYGRPPSSITSIGSTDKRMLPPPLDMAKLPPLPPSRRELQEKARLEQKAKIPLVSTKSAPVVLKQPPVVDREMPPKMPSRPNGPPKMPPRPIANIEEGKSIALPPRRLPPPSSTRSALSLGFGNKSTETPNPTPRPDLTHNRTPAPAIQELNSDNFDRVVVSGKFALVDFYAPYCKYCVELDPHYKQLAEDFAFASDRLVIAKVDVDEHKSFMARYGIQGYPTIMFFDGNGDNPETYQYMRDTAAMTEFLTKKTGISPSDAPKPGGGAPPPINLRSKPTSAQVKAVSAAPTTSSSSMGCLLCRDFSGPDQIASKYSREFLPRSPDNTGYLADVLCHPFSSPTDKARAIFVWLHHNIAYDTGAFFGNRVKNVTPADTIKTGLAVCGGYAGLFTAIALKAGLEAIMITGHGKGFGYAPLKPGESCPPPNPGGHAWNAVRIDGGEWKLIDACWGSGQLGDDQTYNKNLISSYFTMSNEEFGLKHFPADKAHFFRNDTRILSWEEYFIGNIGGEPLQIFSSPEDHHGISQTSIAPPQRHMQASPTSNEIIRFQFSKICTHYDFERNGPGKPYCMLLKIGGIDGRKEDMIPFEFDGFWWWVDVRVKELGARGQTISLFAITSVNGEDARGMTKREYEVKKGKCGMGFAGVAAWELS